MSTLIVQIPRRPRLSAQAPEGAGLRAAAEFDFVLSADGSQVESYGRSAVALLPRATITVMVLDAADLSWHRIALPKAPAGRLRAALAGTLEEALLEDDDDTHLAVQPGARGGDTAWVAATSRPWLRLHIEALEAAGLHVDRVVPAAAPTELAQAHAGAADDGQARMTLADADGVLCMPLTSPVWRTAQPSKDLSWSSSPAAAAAAEQASGHSVPVVAEAERLLATAASPWNLRQFDLVARQKGLRLVREAWARFIGPDWRPVRLGLIGLVAVQVVGVNLWAWQQRRAIVQQRAAVTQVLRDTFPQVRAVIDPPAQMRKEVDLLRAAAGRPGDGDLETLLGVAEAAWPPSRPPAASLKFEPGRLTLAVSDWTPQDTEQFRSQLRAVGVDVEAQTAGRLSLTRSRTAGGV